jgi:hypothetical protein
VKLNTHALRAVLLLSWACLAGVPIAACSSSGASGSTSAGGSSTSADPLSGKSGNQVAAQAVSDLKSAPSFTMKGTIDQSGSALGVNLAYKVGTGCEGTVSQAGKGSFDIVVIGSTAWLKPDDAFWRSYSGSNAAQVIALLGGRYLKGSTSNKNTAEFAKLCDANSLVSSMTLPKNVSKGQVTTLNGQRVLPLTDSRQGSTMYVTDTSKPEIVELVATKPGNSGKVIFAVGAPVSLTVPPATQTVNGAPFGF